MDHRRPIRPSQHPAGTRATRPLGILLASLCLMLVTTGCDELFDRARDPGTTAPDCTGQTPPLQGPWTITGEGRYSGCIDESMNGSFRIETPSAIIVSTAVDPDDPSLTTLSGAVPGNEPPGFSFSGVATGPCVDFEHVETVESGSFSSDRRRMTLTFSGQSDIRRIIDGSFTGSGPGGCSSRGTFRVVVD